MFGQRRGNIKQIALGMLDSQPPRVKMHLAADAAGQERFGPAILAIADNRMPDRGHMHAQLVGAAG